MRVVQLGLNGIGRQVYNYLDRHADLVAAFAAPVTAEDILKEEPAVIVSAGYRHILGPEILEIAPCINLHKSLLPWNRGANPSYWTLRDGTPAGVTIHLMDEGIDTGPILAQREVAVLPADTSRTLYDRLELAQVVLFEEFWPAWCEGKVTPRPQRWRGTYHEKADMVAQRRIELLGAPQRPQEMLRLLQASTHPPFHNAYFEEDGKRYHVRLEVYEASDESPTDGDLQQYPDPGG